VTGVDMLSELSRFFRSWAGHRRLRERTKGVDELLHSPLTAFLIVTSPER